MPKIDYIYCDANVFLAYFNQEKGRTQILDQLFEEVHKNSLKKIITSALTITEVSHIADERNRNRTNATIQQVFEDFWSDTTLIEFIDFNERLARQARDLI
ncbi:MAG: PIN domain-containing protein, partial [Anaerolineae bacterium]|nr:PIN domain-containing protein [Anaerolineae bacterium]